MSGKRSEKKRNREEDTFVIGQDVDQDEKDVENFLFGSKPVSPKDNRPVKKKRKLETAWVDEDEEDVIVNLSRNNRLKKLRAKTTETDVDVSEYEQRLRQNHSTLNSKVDTTWADQYEEEGDLDIDRLSSSVINNTSQFLRDGTINLTRLTDVTKDERIKGVIYSVDFHSSGEVLLVGSNDKHIRLYHLQDDKSERIQSILIDQLAVKSAKFTHDGREIFACGSLPFYCYYDVISGAINTGRVTNRKNRQYDITDCFPSPDNKLVVLKGKRGKFMIMSRNSKMLVGELNMNTDAFTACFSPDSKYFYTAGRGGRVNVWDIKERRCIKKFFDHGSNSTRSLTISPDGEFMATGSSDGVVNLYRTDSLDKSRPVPVKEYMNLTTPISSIGFNHDSQILGFASREIRNAFRLSNTFAGTVYSNFPTEKTPFYSVHTFAFSPDSRRMAIDGPHGTVLLYKLNHYN
eukprot:TRINITY_DN1042_c0_g1_i1.p1 TRINITY_DN1042_c0_g1~~TRINITY_DN1042_c0_g1_i1.p1  ORF type:complete len:461 (-),score=93.38 TRINITY_DN1042_c0_g1_i1:25-1407(-)